MDLLKLLFWNCRGAGNNNFKRNFVEIIRTHKPEIIILMETKVPFSSMGNFFNRLGFTTSTFVDPVDFEEWVLAAVYANPNPVLREKLWDDLEGVAATMSKPWLVAGDFNDYANQGERQSFTSPTTSARTQKFLERINNCNLIDLGNTGSKMTWTNNHQGLANTMERLDRALSNPEWRTMFPEATVRVLPRTYSDHSPLLVYTQGMHILNPT
ncbi:uncharacterized protein LOC114320887 [Camellia sinensis]|uniref:uncharacterized protein LOC114320887 n=1 Tax=Camellia sinensis TaxID=4442 RepID=UPI001035FD7F|nr:uncharacterized protein LOC114320887 [Camellia sinensis]